MLGTAVLSYVDPRGQLAVATLPLLLTLLAILLCARKTPATHRLRSATEPLQELLSRLRVATQVDRAIRLRLFTVFFSLNWLCSLLSQTVLVRRRVPVSTYPWRMWMHKVSFEQFRSFEQYHNGLTFGTEDHYWYPSQPSHTPVEDLPMGEAGTMREEWSLFAGMYCRDFAEGGWLPRELAKARLDCAADASCHAVVCPASAQDGCTLRSSARRVESPQEDCYVYNNTAGDGLVAALLRPMVKIEDVPPFQPPPPPTSPPAPHSPGFTSARKGEEDELALIELQLDYHGGYGLWRLSDILDDESPDFSHMWVQVFATCGSQLCSKQPYNESGAEAYAETMHTEVMIDDRWWPASPPVAGPPRAQQSAPNTAASLGTLTTCASAPLTSTLICLQWSAVRPLLANFVGFDGVFGALPRPLNLCLGAVAPFFLLLAVRPIDTVLVRLVCLILLAGVYMVAADVLVGQIFASVPLYMLGRFQAVPSQLWRGIHGFGLVSLLYVPSLLAARRFAAAMYCPPRRGLNLSWRALRELLASYSLLLLALLSSDLAIMWVDRAAIPPNRNPYIIWAVVDARSLFRSFGAYLISLAFTQSNRGRLFRAVGGFGEASSSRGLAAIAALAMPASRAEDTHAARRCWRFGGWRETECSVLAAAGRFRGLPWSALEARHLSSSLGSAELSAATVPVKLGGVDAFISHSWADDGEPQGRRVGASFV